MAFVWGDAAVTLLGALGLRIDLNKNVKLDDLPTLLRGSGVELVKLSLLKNTLPYCEGMLGAFFERKDRTWIAVIGGAQNLHLLTVEGGIDRSLVESDLNDVVSVFALRETSAVLSKGIAPFLLRHKSKFVDLFVCALIINFFSLTLPIFSSFVYDKILGNGITETLWALVIGLSFVLGIEFCVRILRVGIAERFSMLSEIDIDHSTFLSLLNSKMNTIPALGVLLEKYKQILSYRDFLSSSYLLAVADMPFLLLYLIAIAIVAGPLVFIPVVCGALVLLVSYATMAPILNYEQVAARASEKRFGIMADVLTAREAIIGTMFRDELRHRWRMASLATIEGQSNARYWRGWTASLMNSMGSISFIAILVGGVYMIEAHQMTSGGLLAVSMLTARAMSIFSSASMLFLRYREFKTALKELNQMVPLSRDVCSRGRAVVHGKFRGDLRIDRVTCGLQSDRSPVLKEVSLSIRMGEIVGIAGAPGAGKTTLLRLIAGALLPDEGNVLIDNIPVEHISEDDLGVNIGFKPQDICLIEGSVEDNVRAGRAEFSAGTRKEVLMKSGLMHAFQENGLNWATQVGVRGSQLSGGQRQLVALARAMLGSPSLLILDEPTNGLDASLESYLAQQISDMRGKQTVLISTHSRSILTVCDRIIVVGQARILADGPREKVLV